MNKKFNFMDSIYGVLDSKEVDYNDDVTFIDNQEDYFDNEFYDGGDDVTIIGEFEEDEFNLDLGEGFIPLPKGNYDDCPVIVIDEYYNLDEYEVDLVQESFVEYDKLLYSTIEEKEYEPIIDIDSVEGIADFKEETEPVEELSSINVSSDEDRIVKAMTRDYIENINVETQNKDSLDVTDDTSWVDGPDLFGNDISVILADNPESEFVEEDFVEGTFEQWLSENSEENIIY